MQKIRSILIFLLGILLFSPSISLAKKNTITAVELHQENNEIQLKFTSKNPPFFHLFTLENPNRVVIDLKNTNMFSNFPSVKKITLIEKIRAAEKENDIFRVVIDLKNKPQKVLSSPTTENKDGTHSLSVSIANAPPPKEAPTSFEEIIENALNEDIPIPAPSPVLANKAPTIRIPNPTAKPNQTPKPIIIIDAGHGGHDPGSIGKRGTKEKDITLAFAKELHHHLKATGKYTPILTRSTDKYITLRGRVAIARKHKADLFVSLHADSHNNPHVKGMSIYTLSDTASDKEAAALARKENTSDIITGIDLQHEDRDITNVLISIAQRDTMNQSSAFAEKIVKSAENQITLLRNPHRFAGFRVLTAADVPSVLIELGYLSNYREEKLLTTEKHKKELVQILIKAINAHF